jgi:hypothetical protein
VVVVKALMVLSLFGSTLMSQYALIKDGNVVNVAVWMRTERDLDG